MGTRSSAVWQVLREAAGGRGGRAASKETVNHEGRMAGGQLTVPVRGSKREWARGQPAMVLGRASGEVLTLQVGIALPLYRQVGTSRTAQQGDRSGTIEPVARRDSGAQVTNVAFRGSDQNRHRRRGTRSGAHEGLAAGAGGTPGEDRGLGVTGTRISGEGGSSKAASLMVTPRAVAVCRSSDNEGYRPKMGIRAGRRPGGNSRVQHRPRDEDGCACRNSASAST